MLLFAIKSSKDYRQQNEISFFSSTYFHESVSRSKKRMREKVHYHTKLAVDDGKLTRVFQSAAVKSSHMHGVLHCREKRTKRKRTQFMFIHYRVHHRKSDLFYPRFEILLRLAYKVVVLEKTLHQAHVCAGKSFSQVSEL